MSTFSIQQPQSDLSRHFQRFSNDALIDEKHTAARAMLDHRVEAPYWRSRQPFVWYFGRVIAECVRRGL